MTKEELEKYTVEFMNKYNNIKYAKIESVMGKLLLAYAEPFEKRIEELEKENAELQHKIDTLQGFLDRDVEFDNLQKENSELKDELKKWKDEWQEQVQKATDEGYARTLQTIQLSKAKEHIRTLISCLIDYVQEGDKDYCHIADAEQFLNENSTYERIQKAKYNYTD